MIRVKLMPPLTQRHVIIGSIMLVGLVIWLWKSHLLPNVSDGVPMLSQPFAYGPKLSPSPDDHLNNTLPRYRSASHDLATAMKQMTRPLEPRLIMGLVFYGRRTTVSILDCYLRRNLVKNGGMLDGVIFLVRTKDSADLAVLDRMLEEEPDYVQWSVDLKHDGFATSYELIEDDVLYIKMDDDIVFVEDSAIPSLIQTKISRPDTFVVSANVVNQPMISWIHWNLGAIKPYLPDLAKHYTKPAAGQSIDWRTSVLPAWEGPEEFDALWWEPPEGRKHRWLPARGRTHHALDYTPISHTEYQPLGAGWYDWKIGAQEHLSFFENLEKNELWRYKFHTWDFQYNRMGIQFVALMGKDINSAKPIDDDDEQHFAVTMPQSLGRHAVADGRGVVAHYSFNIQFEPGMRTTDILERYRAFAEESICAGPLVWTPEHDLEPRPLDAGLEPQYQEIVIEQYIDSK
ncbi:hypothetical protein S40293_07747 [Stachybotrys chartarum IBT 40293]|nr:hypothetical protein S40293_07747 [Stachybotrys chartarum IBT 40293]